MSDKMALFELRAALAAREAVIRMLEQDLREVDGKRRKLLSALAEAVEKSGNPELWLDKAKKALEDWL